MRFRNFIIFLLLLDPLSSFDLKCTSLTNVFTTAIGTINYCQVNSATITSLNEIITSVNGVTTPTTFQGLYFPSMVVHYLPKGIGKFFPQLRGIIVQSTGLKSIQAADLEGLNNLESLQIYNTDIEELSSDLLKFTPKINDWYFTNNQISRVGKDFLTNFHSFNRFDFSGNKCITSHASSDMGTRKDELRTKCPHPTEKIVSEDSKKLENEITSLKKKHLEKEAELGKEIEALKSQKSSMEVEISELKTENDRLKRTWYNGLLDSSTKLLHKVTKKLEECRTERVMGKFIEIGAEVVLKVMSTTENATILEMNVESPESKVTKMVDASGNDVQPNQTEIVVDQQNALFLPVNLGRFFPSLLQLSVTFSGLYGLDNRTFFGMQNLVAIKFTGNKLVEISEDAFAELSSLKELDLSHNNIEAIHDAAFEQNVDLEILKLNHNQLTAINSPIFKHQKKLRILFLNENQLKFINGLLLSTSKALEVVDLRNNQCINVSHPNTTLNEIESIIMDQCNAPVELKCNHEITDSQTDENYCQAESLELIYIGSTLSLEMAEIGRKILKLSIIGQKMLFMPSKLSETLPNLIQLVVEKSQLTALHKSDFKGLASLKEITIERNNISLIEEGVFDEVPQITYLSLADNHIESLPPKAFVKLTKLKTLVLSGNKLKKFTASLLPKKPVIKEIHLRENILEMIDNKIIKMLRNADLIDFSGNSCIDIQYQKSNPRSKTIKELSVDVDFGCDEDSEED